MKKSERCCVLPDPIKKHQRVQLSWISEKRIVNIHKQPGYSRKVDPYLFLSNPNLSKAIEKSNLNIDEALHHARKAILESATTTTRRKTNKPWFDADCIGAQKLCKELFKQLTHNLFTAKEYQVARKSYKYITQTKRNTFNEQKLIEKLENSISKPWIMFEKPGKPNSSNISPDNWTRHFQTLLWSKDNDIRITSPTDNPSILNSSTDENFNSSWYNYPITDEEVFFAISKSKKKKAPGPDDLTYEHIQQTSSTMLHFWTNIFNSVLTSDHLPVQWTTSTLHMLFKGKGKIDDPNNYRGIALMSCPLKILTSIINNKIVTHTFHLLPNEQHGFRRLKAAFLSYSQTSPLKFINPAQNAKLGRV
ncbi:LINE-1 retrotransposable element ORF2 protein [Nymphon striatum]|nr:LINE-1 retrotransposable element ORF2 protein [Nymphon striatum]